MEKATGKYRAIEIALFLIMLFLAFLLADSAVGGHGNTLDDQVRALNDGWYYLDEGRAIEVTLPTVITKKEIGPLVLCHKTDPVQMAGRTLTTKGARYRLQTAVDDIRLFEYRDDYFPRNAQMADKLNCDMTLPLDMKDKVLKLIFEDTEEGRFHIGPVYYGTGSAVFQFHCLDDMPAILMVLAMSVLSVFAIAVSVYLRHVKMSESRFIHAAWFMILCGVWCITDSSIVQRLTAMSPITNLVSFYAFMTMAIPMIRLIRDTEDMKKYRSLEYCIYAFYVNAILQSVLNYLDICEFIDMLFMTHLLLVVGISLIIALLWKEYRQTGNKNLFTILRAFVIVSFGGVLSLILYWTLEITYYELIYEAGILLFMIYLLFWVVRDMVDNSKFRTEAMVFQRLARVDSLTGMGNRRAFDEFLEEFEEKSDTYENAMLIFLDINRLKDINDRSGHGAGDEMIITASRCIEHAFAPEGHCFRIDGDEFCAVVLDPKLTEEEWLERLNRELYHYNQGCRNRISIARGISYLTEKGVRKNVSDWKYEADQRMRENKGWRKLEEKGNTR